MWYQAISYIKFLFKSTNQHGVHSPFVFDLVSKCFYDKQTYESYEVIKSYRKRLLHDHRIVSVTDLGSGSRLTKSNQRTISSIAKRSGTTSKKARLLFKIVKYFKAKAILELGTSLGIASHAMKLADSDVKITTIEGCPSISEVAKANFHLNKMNDIKLLTGDFKDIIPDLINNTYDLIFFDGNHQKDATLSYFEKLLKTTHNESVWIFDDIYWSKSMTEAWEQIKQHPKVSVSIDTFHYGFVFFRKEQLKENFMIRL